MQATTVCNVACSLAAKANNALVGKTHSRLPDLGQSTYYLPSPHLTQLSARDRPWKCAIYVTTERNQQDIDIHEAVYRYWNRGCEFHRVRGEHILATGEQPGSARQT